ncbi:MAG: alternative ribosome rescue aminoacyl-tRNA hydrolase ArfB [Aeromicrobium sp.]
MSHSGRIALPESEMTWRFSRSSGAGGQHVNTTDTRAELSWSLDNTTVLTADQRALAAQRLRSRLVDGTITVVSSRFRSQHRNREAARVRLEELVTQAIVPPKPRRPTRRTRASVERRLDAKKRRGSIKKSRGGRWD